MLIQNNKPGSSFFYFTFTQYEFVYGPVITKTTDESQTSHRQVQASQRQVTDKSQTTKGKSHNTADESQTSHDDYRRISDEYS